MIKDTIADQLIYSTVKIVCVENNCQSIGTGFFMNLPMGDGTNIEAIVTNKHVINGYDFAFITVVGANDDETPNNQKHISLQIPNLQRRTFLHPDKDIDICLLFINDLIKAKNESGERVYYRSIGCDMAISEEQTENLTSMEDIIMIGYPNGFSDDFNNKPVIRKGITATSIKLNYENKSEFLADISVYFGSSGSPVFLRKTGLAKENNGEGLTIGVSPMYAFLGVLYAMKTVNVNGIAIREEIPTALKSQVITNMPINLGYVIKANKIIEAFEFQKQIIKSESRSDL